MECQGRWMEARWVILTKCLADASREQCGGGRDSLLLSIHCQYHGSIAFYDPITALGYTKMLLPMARWAMRERLMTRPTQDFTLLYSHKIFCHSVTQWASKSVVGFHWPPLLINRNPIDPTPLGKQHLFWDLPSGGSDLQVWGTNARVSSLSYIMHECPETWECMKCYLASAHPSSCPRPTVSPLPTRIILSISQIRAPRLKRSLELITQHSQDLVLTFHYRAHQQNVSLPIQRGSPN